MFLSIPLAPTGMMRMPCSAADATEVASDSRMAWVSWGGASRTRNSSRARALGLQLWLSTPSLSPSCDGLGEVTAAVGPLRGELAEHGLDVAREREAADQVLVAVVPVEVDAEPEVEVAAELGLDPLDHVAELDLEVLELVGHRPGGVDHEHDVEIGRGADGRDLEQQRIEAVGQLGQLE